MVNKKQLEIGTKIEKKEHGLPIKLAIKIAMDHLKENPRYYMNEKKRCKRTSINNGHFHTWKYGYKKTSVDNNHSHPIDFNKRIAKKGKTNHVHKLLKT